MEPGFLHAHSWLAIAYMGLGRYDDAVRIAEEAYALSQNALPFRGLVAGVYGQIGRIDEARKIIREVVRSPDAPPFFMALLHLTINEHEQVYEWLDRGVGERGDLMHSLRTNPFFIKAWRIRDSRRCWSACGWGRRWNLPPNALTGDCGPSLATTLEYAPVQGWLVAIRGRACLNVSVRHEAKMTQSNTTQVSQSIAGPAGPLHVDDGGDGAGVPVVFVHSFGGSTAHWPAQLAYLRKSRRALAVDLRGHGLSARPADNNYSYRIAGCRYRRSCRRS